VTRGLTTTQIAQLLIMSPRTADAHLRSIDSKLEVTSRAAATRSALEHQIV
jgi:DNA-binding CsgD family transcriptional regulator